MAHTIERETTGDIRYCTYCAERVDVYLSAHEEETCFLCGEVDGLFESEGEAREAGEWDAAERAWEIARDDAYGL